MKKLLYLLIYVVVLVVAIIDYPAEMKRKRLASALATGHLAILPAQAHNIEADTEGNLFARSYWVTFTASDADIQRWLLESPTLAANKPTRCARPVLFGERPAWFRPEGIRDGLLYHIPQDRNADYGTVWIDRETQTVYIKTSHS
ncbi:MAG: hypothetical protein ACRYFZ_20315 [Janthinobacterium lividum]